MKWALGTGRCGTHSYAAQTGGLHEPKPAILRAGEAWADERLGRRGDAYDDTAAILRTRAVLGAPCVADLHQSWAIDIIREVDPEPSFVWLVRPPEELVRSMLGGNWWHPRNAAARHDETLWHPPGGWPEDAARLDKITLYWRGVNEAIMRARCDGTTEEWEVLTPDMLTKHVGAYPHAKPPLDAGDLGYIRLVTGDLWAEIQAGPLGAA